MDELFPIKIKLQCLLCLGPASQWTGSGPPNPAPQMRQSIAEATPETVAGSSWLAISNVNVIRAGLSGLRSPTSPHDTQPVSQMPSTHRATAHGWARLSF